MSPLPPFAFMSSTPVRAPDTRDAPPPPSPPCPPLQRTLRHQLDVPGDATEISVLAHPPDKDGSLAALFTLRGTDCDNKVGRGRVDGPHPPPLPHTHTQTRATQERHEGLTLTTSSPTPPFPNPRPSTRRERWRSGSEVSKLCTRGQQRLRRLWSPPLSLLSWLARTSRARASRSSAQALCAAPSKQLQRQRRSVPVGTPTAVVSVSARAPPGCPCLPLLPWYLTGACVMGTTLTLSHCQR